MTELVLFWTFFKIGAFTFGGGYAMLPLVQQEVLKHGWMTSEELVNFLAVSESTPGPFAVNVSTYVGAHTAGLTGAFMATLGVVLPSFIIILVIAKAFAAFQKNRYVEGVMSGLRPTVVGLIGASVLSVGKTVFFPDGLKTTVFTGASFWISVLIFALCLWLTLRKKTHPIKLILLSAAIGIVCGLTGLLG